MRRLCRFFLILIFACTVAGCSDGGGAITLFWAEPIRQKYSVGEPFIPNNDVKAYTTSEQGGERKEVLLNQVKISLAKLPFDPEAELEEVAYDKGCTLGTPGTNIVILEYESSSFNYPIEVSASAGTSGGSGIVIKWEGDK